MTGPITLPPPPAPRAPTTADGGIAVQSRRARVLLAGVGIVAALAVSGTALGIALTRSDAVSQTAPAATLAAVTPGPIAGPDDRELCNAIESLVTENTTTVNTFAGLGERGTPARDAGIAGFQASIRDWVARIEPVLNAHPDASEYLTRNFQRYIDDNRIYAARLTPGRGVPADEAAWNDATVALGAGTDVCGTRLGLPRWQ